MDELIVFRSAAVGLLDYCRIIACQRSHGLLDYWIIALERRLGLLDYWITASPIIRSCRIIRRIIRRYNPCQGRTPPGFLRRRLCGPIPLGFLRRRLGRPWPAALAALPADPMSPHPATSRDHHSPSGRALRVAPPNKRVSPRFSFNT